MNVESIIATIEGLAPPANVDALNVEHLLANAYFGVRTDGSAALFFELARTNRDTCTRVTRALDVLVSGSFEIVSRSTRGMKESKPGLALILRDRNRLWCFAVLIAEIREALSCDESLLDDVEAIDEYIDRWIEFFSNEPLPIERIVGLWGELFVITQFEDLDRGVATWVGPFGDPYDFLGGGVSLEVKTQLGHRESWFSLDQVDRNDSAYAVFIKVLADRMGGRSIDDLVHSIGASIKSLTNFQCALAKSGYLPGCGESIRLAAEQVFAVPMSTIPRPQCDDVRICRVRYAVNTDSLSNSCVPLKPLLTRLQWGKLM